MKKTAHQYDFPAPINVTESWQKYGAKYEACEEERAKESEFALWSARKVELFDPIVEGSGGGFHDPVLR